MTYSPIYRWLIFLLVISSCSTSTEINQSENHQTIDRKSLVQRNSITHQSKDSLHAISLGNGNFAFTVDFTGMQSFPDHYNQGIPLGTLSNWAWHSSPNSQSYHLDQVTKSFEVNGRKVNYIHDFRSEGETELAKASDYLRKNPHRWQLGTVGLEIIKTDGSVADINALNPISQHLDLWEGLLTSKFSVEDEIVTIQTVCHPTRDQVSVSIESDLIQKKRLIVKVSFQQADDGWKNMITPDHKPSHQSEIVLKDSTILSIKRSQDNDEYQMGIKFDPSQVSNPENHLYLISPENETDQFKFSFMFSPESETGSLLDFSTALEDARNFWEDYWNQVGVIDFSSASDPRAVELERRVILSQYLTRIQTSGNLPPQETGLTFNSWYGKFHMEMVWWHGVHYGLYNQTAILENYLTYYDKLKEPASFTADKQGYQGTRWPKMIGPEGNESPSTIGTYLIWQQPHPIFLAEVLYLNSPDKDHVLSKYKALIKNTADFMASYAWEDTISGRYILGPALIPAQERFDPASTINPAFELVYWWWGLNTAIEWMERLNESVPPEWIKVRDGLSDLTVQNELYLFTEDATDSYTTERYLTDHPMILGILGILPDTEKVDPKIVANTYEKVNQVWHWNDTWGWDFPMAAMTAARLDRPEDAIDFLLKDITTNTYLPNGHNYQNDRLPIYLPGNGGLLTAVALMCKTDKFPKNGQWEVKWENLGIYP